MKALFLFSFYLLIVTSSITAQSKFLKILFLGNSITFHGAKAELDWSGNWGMAASAEDKDYVHVFKRQLDSAQGVTSSYYVKSFTSFESNFYKFDSKAFFSFIDTLRPDLIVIHVGDNIKPDTALKYDLGQHYTNLIKYLQSKCPNTSISVMTKFWANKIIDTSIVNSAKVTGVLLVDLSHITLDTMSYARSERIFRNSGVGYHPGDKGMQGIGDSLFSAVYNMLLKPTGINEVQMVSTDFDIKNFPNPFNPSTVIKYSIPENSIVTIRVYNLLGRELATLLKEQKAAGIYSITFNGNNLPSGIYICSIETIFGTKAQKMLLLR